MHHWYSSTSMCTIYSHYIVCFTTGQTYASRIPNRKRAWPFYPYQFSGAPSRLVDLILGGKLDALRHDLPELPELDNLFAPEVRPLLLFSLGTRTIHFMGSYLVDSGSAYFCPIVQSSCVTNLF